MKRNLHKGPRREMALASYDPNVINLLGLPLSSRAVTVKSALKAVFRTHCKPCWELKYCPYGPLVEQFPLPRLIRQDAIEHNEFLKKELAEGNYDAARTRMFSAQVKKFDALSYPERIPEEEQYMGCHIFGHYCPAFFMSESFTETSDLRKGGTSISFQTKLRVARRDNYTCQECGRDLTPKNWTI